MYLSKVPERASNASERNNSACLPLEAGLKGQGCKLFQHWRGPALPRHQAGKQAKLFLFITVLLAAGYTDSCQGETLGRREVSSAHLG